MTPHQILRFIQQATSTIAVRTQTATASSKDRGSLVAEYGVLIATVVVVVLSSIALFSGVLFALFLDANGRFPTSR